MPVRRSAAAAAVVLLAGAAPALARLDPAAHGSLLAGASHPLFGADHVLAMVAVGLWAATIGGRAVLAVPISFVAAMTAGFVLALAGVALPVVEPVVLASVVALGLLVAAAARLPPVPAAGLVAVFALFHGHAHGAELGGAGAASFGLGFALATASLHGVGVVLGLATARLGRPGLTRLLGGASALAGLALLVG